jgi:hypothetical protein
MKERIYHRLTLITCSGLSNTGKLTTQTTSQLLREDLVTFDPDLKDSGPSGILYRKQLKRTVSSFLTGA